MLTKVDWYDADKTIVIQVYEGKLTGEDLLKSSELTYDLYNSVKREIYIIGDFSKLKGIPGSILPAMKEIEQKNYSNKSVSFIIAASTYIAALGQIVKTLMPHVMEDMYFVSSIEVALQKINEMKAKANNG
jgi:hypothetical protein